ncbi:MAG: polysaccharide pyruvyl transferase family protein [Pleurocapsa sp.]
MIPENLSEFEPFAQKAIAGEILQTEIQCLKKCDLVVINGEGSIYDRQRKGRMMLFVAYLAKRHFNKPCILVNHTADVHDPIMAEMVSCIYPMLDDVVFREPLSAEACSNFIREDNSLLAADAAFTYRPMPKTVWSSVAEREGYFSIWPDSAVGFNPQKPYICVGGSSIYLRPDRPQYDPIPGFIELCIALQNIAPVVLTAPCQTDEKIFRPVAKELNLPLIALSTPTQQAVDILGHASAYISGRWHPSILALTGGTPIVTLTANTYKTQALLKQIGLDAPTFDALRLHEEKESIVALTDSYIKEGNELRQRLRQRAEELSKLTWQNVRYLHNRQISTEIANSAKNLFHQTV